MLRPLFILLAAGLFAGCDGKTFVQKAKSMSPTIRADETVRVDMEAYKNTAPAAVGHRVVPSAGGGCGGGEG